MTSQFPVAAVAPGDRDYHGGKRAFHAVEWNVDPYLLTSASQVLEAAAYGDVTITRVPENDFKCPIQPSNGQPILIASVTVDSNVTFEPSCQQVLGVDAKAAADQFSSYRRK